MNPGSESLFEYRISHDTNLLGGEALARVEYRREGVRRWSRFVVVLDDETTYETVADNIDSLLLLHEAKS